MSIVRIIGVVMENKQEVPYFVHEGEMWRLERIIRRLTVAMVVESALFIAYIVITR